MWPSVRVKRERELLCCVIHSSHLGCIVLNPFDQRRINPFALHWTGLSYGSTAILLIAVVLICTDPGCDPGSFFQCDLYSCAVDFLPIVVSYSIMSDTDSDADSISDSSNAHVDVDGGAEAISSAVRELCNQLRANDTRVLGHGSFFTPFKNQGKYSDVEQIAVFQALKDNTIVSTSKLP